APRGQPPPATTAEEREAVEERKQKIARFMAKIARAVHYIHEQGLIHRDLKPGNILLDALGEPLVADLGLARRIKDDRAEAPPLDRAEPAEERTRGAAGTPGYMA